jgi:inositol-pentakisphosphate 2-kinase
VQRYWENEVRPLFRDPDACLVRQQLVVVRRDISAACNRLLAAAEAEDERDDKFAGDWLCDGPQLAMIVDDMRPPPRSLDMMGEFKPKWLTQSPSAPVGSVRCRTCATYLRRFILKPSGSSLSGFQRACRLRLCDENPSPPQTPITEEAPSVPSPHSPMPKSRSDAPPLKRAATFPASVPRISSTSPSNAPADTPIWSKEALLSSIRAHPLMRELRTIQARLDTCGPLAATQDDADFQKAMTLRDCTCYVYVSRSGGATSISVRLGDLDRKDGTTKSDYWRRTEQTLIESGFYTVRSIRVDGDEFEVPVKCVLSHGPSTGPGVGPVMEVRGVGKERLEEGHTIVVLEATKDGSRDAVLGMKDVDKLRHELEGLRHEKEGAVGTAENNHKKRKLNA